MRTSVADASACATHSCGVRLPAVDSFRHDVWVFPPDGEGGLPGEATRLWAAVDLAEKVSGAAPDSQLGTDRVLLGDRPEDVPSSVELRRRSGEHQAALTS
jgi:hypothetical protein